MNNTVVVIRSMRFLGGHLVTYPLLHQIKQYYPEDPLVIVGTDPVAAHYLDTPWVDSFVQAHTLSQKRRAFLQAKRIFVLHYSSEQYAPLSFTCGVPTRVGFRNGRLGDFLWTHSHKKDAQDYLGLANLALLRALHAFEPLSAARQAIQTFAQQAPVACDLPADIVFMPGGGAGEYKRWRIQAYVELMTRLQHWLGAHTQFTFVMGPNERRETEFLRRLGQPYVHIAENWSMPAIAALVLRARLIVANDCGPSHLAQSANAPYVGIFHRANPQWFWTRSKARAVIPDDGQGNIQAVRPEQVMLACQAVLHAAGATKAYQDAAVISE